MDIRKKILTAFFLLFTALILTHSDISLLFALNGLNLWFQKMIPTLVPFMILSGIMVRMNLTEDFSALLSPILRPIFSISKNGIYCIIMGFLCGFPMGAKVITELYGRGRIGKAEATYLLSFCNNIGPIYFMGFALPTIGITENLFVYLFGMYGLPLLYGIFLRYTCFRGSLSSPDKQPIAANNQPANQGLLYHIDDAIMSALNSITALGGYMIFFNLLNLIPYVLLSKTKLQNILPVINGILEISGGLGNMKDTFPFLSLVLLPFGGLSCIAQTYSIIRHTDLSIQTYVIHKVILSAITALYYFFVL